MRHLVEQAINNAYEIAQRSLEDFRGGFPTTYSTNNVYGKGSNYEWTPGFYTGYLWLLNEYKENPSFLEVIEEHIRSFRERIDQKICTETHDLGFLYSLSCVAAYKLTGDEFAKETALIAADELARRFRTNGQFIQAWGKLDVPSNHRLIIDCLLNLPLLYWATAVTEDKKYHEMAYAHLKTALPNIIRGDYSTHHTYYFDYETGKPSYGATHQGYKNDSTWARGQAWGIYGIALSYEYTGDDSLIPLFIGVTEYSMRYLPIDSIPYWDLTFTEGDEPRDSSAAAIAVCGMLEMKKYIKDEVYCKKLEEYIERIISSLIKNYAAKPEDTTNGLLYKGTYGRKSPYNDCPNHGVDECVLWGDYFYVEALMIIYKPDWKMYW